MYYNTKASGARIRELRLAKKLDQIELAELLNVSHGYAGLTILLSSHSFFTQWGQLGAILGGVQIPWSGATSRRLMISHGSGVSRTN